MASYVLLRLCHVVCPISDHAEVSHNSRLPYTNRLSHTQGICRDGEEPLGRLLAVFYEFRTGWLRDSWFDPFRVESRYDLPPSPLGQTSEASEAMAIPDLPFDEYRVCIFQLSENTVIYVVLSLVYGTFFLLSTAHPPASNTLIVKDA